MLGSFKRALDVEHGQHEEHESLHGLAQKEEGVDGQGAEYGSHYEEQHHNNFFTANVTEKTE